MGRNRSLVDSHSVTVGRNSDYTVSGVLGGIDRNKWDREDIRSAISAIELAKMIEYTLNQSQEMIDRLSRRTVNIADELRSLSQATAPAR
jgi:hypothetical protein